MKRVHRKHSTQIKCSRVLLILKIYGLLSLIYGIIILAKSLYVKVDLCLTTYFEIHLNEFLSWMFNFKSGTRLMMFALVCIKVHTVVTLS